MGYDKSNNDEQVGVIDYKQKVQEIYPDAYYYKDGRHGYFYPDKNGETIKVTHYNHSIILSKGGRCISYSRYTEEGAWEYAWHFIEDEMLRKLES